MPVVVGVDAGGTHTSAVAALGGNVIGAFDGPPANLRTAGVEDAADMILRAIRTALGGHDAAAVHVGAAGAGDEELAKRLQAALRAHLSGVKLSVSNDALIALRAAVPSGDGVVLVAGTGSMAYAVAGDADARSGGFGHLLGDEGSAYAIGAAALRIALRSHDGRSPRTALTDALERSLAASDPQALLSAVAAEGRPVTRIASLASLVVRFADSGDRDAAKIVQSAALELFELVRSAASRAGLLQREFPIAFAGGLFAANSMLSYLVETRIAGDIPLARVVKGAPAPQFGALALAGNLLA